ncbi:MULTISPECIES: TRAP transporter large permease [Peptoniphilus]|uniref:TRAP transporter large permease n=1 Tax=Peptoniphilus TaxID=162289 RepID=UPI0001DA9DDD|nr:MULTISPECIES: TRAP transporter large permease [Peptoniphilus]EFI41440.1 TRAP transporter, DctM subunit [Peptoniphilus sp. oral taxon 386 str. F0131]
MNTTFISLLPILIVLILYFSSVPIVFALFGSTLFYFLFIDSGTSAVLVFQKFVSSTQNFSLLAIPFFIMAGSIMNYSGISEKLMEFADVLTGHLKGGLGHVNIVLSLLMGGVSGSANADAAMEAKMLVPEMERKGYSKEFSSAITAASSAVTPVIPPGINLIIYGIIASVSVSKMFIAGYVPGVLMSVALMITVALIAHKRDYSPTREKKATAGEIFTQAGKSIWALLFPFGIIASIRIGMITPSEAGAIAILYTVIVGKFIYKKLKWSDFIEIFKETVYGTGSVVLIIVAANVFGYYLSWEGIPQKLTQTMLGITTNKYLMLAFCNVILLILGMFIEGGAAMVITAPLLVPLMVQLGVDPLHFGMIIIVNIMLGGITPPFGSMMFTVCGITNCTIGGFVKEVWPFILALLVVLLIVTYCPILITFLPELIG